MNQDHYAVLGVTPTAPPAEIRAAYLALMREYHPDRNSSAAAVARAQAIGAAYKVLGDFDRRQEYDWDLRREREAAAALAATPRRRIPAGVIAAGAIALAAVGAVMLWPDGAPAPRARIVEAARPGSTPVRQPARAVTVAVARAIPAPIAPRVEPVRTVAVKQMMVNPIRTERPREIAPMRIAAVLGKAKVAVAEPVKPTIEAVVAAPVNAPLAVVAMPAPRPATDLASLDQFVMSFYGQSWRFGDEKKRAALQQSRDGFVVRRGTCAAEPCKRAAYLKLMRDVSAIVESGQPAR